MTIKQIDLPYNFLIPDTTNVQDLLEGFAENFSADLNCHAVATITDVSNLSINQTVKATVNYQQVFFLLDKATQQFVQKSVPYPILLDCPVIFPGGGATALTFPVAVGDECLVLFNDRDIDQWFAGASNFTPATLRKHSFSDGIILVGVRSIPNIVKFFDTTRAMLRAGSIINQITAVGVNPSNRKVLITNTYPANTTTLNSLLQDLITEVKNLVNATAAITVTGVQTGAGVSGVPANAATISAIATNLTATANQIAGILE